METEGNLNLFVVITLRIFLSMRYEVKMVRVYIYIYIYIEKINKRKFSSHFKIYMCYLIATKTPIQHIICIYLYIYVYYI